jgi:hypothetical protein
MEGVGRLLHRHVLLSLAAIVSVSCASNSIQDFEKWTRHYEAKMGLPAHKVLQAENPDHCSWVWIPTDSGFALARPTIFYTGEDWRGGCPKGARYYALHEVCHIKWRHLFLKMDYEEMEREVDELCVPRYLQR